MQLSFQYKKTHIFYKKTGSGEAVILLHGFGEDSSVWDKQAITLAQSYLLLIPDLPGTGQSDLLNVAGDKPVSIDDYAECIFALYQHENLDKFALFGHSMGGYIALAFAEKYADTLRGFGLLHSTAFADNDEKKESRIKGIKLIEQYGGYSFLKNTIPNLFAETFKADTMMK